MILDILKDSNLWEKLETANNRILEVSKTFDYYAWDDHYDPTRDRISTWFNPDRIKSMPTGRCYPNIAPEQQKAEYSLVLFPANYLTLFLLDKLYFGKNILIEDVGAGVGHFAVYANVLGFNYFHFIENFCQVSRQSMERMIDAFSIDPYINEKSTKPHVINNVALFKEGLIKVNSNLELVCVNTNPEAVTWVHQELTSQGFRFLCHDRDYFQVAYCREYRYESFKQILSQYEYVGDPIRIPQYEPLTGRLEKKAVNQYMENPGFLTEFKKTEEFENRISEYLGVDHTVVVNNGTISLSLALLAVGIKQGDKVIVPNLTMIATLNAIRLIGAEPVLVDVDSRLLLDLHKAKSIIEGDPRVRAVIFVALNGRSLGLEDLWFIEYCKHKYLGVEEPYTKQLYLIEDSAQSFGSRLWDSNLIGALSLFDINSFSFSMPKIITTGQGGCLTTHSEEIAKNLRKLKDFGRTSGGNDTHDTFGINCKFTELQAVIGLEQLKDMPYRTERKKAIYNLYKEQLSSVGQVQFVPTDTNYTVPWFVDIFVAEPVKLAEHLKKYDIGTRLIYPPLHTQKVNRGKFNTYESFPVSSEMCSRGIWLPSSFTLTDNQIMRICDCIKEYYGK